MKIICGLFLCFGLIASAYAQTAEMKWKSIRLLHSTRKDVEKLYGAPKAASFITTYETAAEKINVTYSETTCRENESAYWDVAKGTVLSMVIAPKVYLGVKDFIAQSGKTFEKMRDAEMPQRFHYQSADRTISFSAEAFTEQGEEVVSIFYNPTEADNHLRCQTKKL